MKFRVFLVVLFAVCFCSCDQTPKPVTDSTGLLTVEVTDTGIQLSIKKVDGIARAFVTRTNSGGTERENCFDVYNMSNSDGKEYFIITDEWVKPDVLYTYRVMLVQSVNDKIENPISDELKIKASAGKGEFVIINKPSLSFDSATNTFTFSEALQSSYSETFDLNRQILIHYSNSDDYSYETVYFDSLSFTLEPYNEALYNKPCSIDFIRGDARILRDDGMIFWYTANTLTKDDVSFPGTFVLTK